MGVDRSDGCYICPVCGEHVKFSQAELHGCLIVGKKKKADR